MSKLSNYPTAKRIPWAPGYAATKDGKILSLPRVITNKSKNISFNQKKNDLLELRQVPNGSNGQLKVDLMINRERKTVYVKNVVAELFVDKYKKLVNPTVIHSDFDKTNNSADNLEYVSYAYMCRLNVDRNKKLNK